MNQRAIKSLLSAALMTAAASSLFAACFSGSTQPDQAQDIQPLGSVVVCDSTVADICLAAADPQACLQRLGALCPDVVAVDTATCETKFAEACQAQGLDKIICGESATKVCATFKTPGVCYDDTYGACSSLGGADALCTDVANGMCANPDAVSCDDFVSKLCGAIPLSQEKCDGARAALCAAGGAPGGASDDADAGGAGGGGSDPTTVIGPGSASCPDYIQGICEANNVPKADCDARIAAYCK